MFPMVAVACTTALALVMRSLCANVLPNPVCQFGRLVSPGNHSSGQLWLAAAGSSHSGEISVGGAFR
jgi:hypothetical protein